jgi:tRNA uridine 5-carboxymethylaminomethyl modification enzyme
MEKGYSIGLVQENIHERFREKKRLMFGEIERLKRVRIKPSDEISDTLTSLGTSAISEDTALDKILKRPEIKYDFIKKFAPAPEALTSEIEGLVEISVKYEGYIQKQLEMAEKLKKFESKKIPTNFNYKAIPGLSKEIVEKLSEIQPETIGQTSRIPGITPAAVSIILVSVERHWKEKNF